MHHAARHSVSQYVLVLVIVVVLAAGWYGRKLWQHNDDVKSLKQRLGNAQRARRKALAFAGLVGFVLVAMFMHWMHVNGG